jgi:hypothetical protein
MNGSEDSRTMDHFWEQVSGYLSFDNSEAHGLLPKDALCAPLGSFWGVIARHPDWRTTYPLMTRSNQPLKISDLKPLSGTALIILYETAAYTGIGYNQFSGPFALNYPHRFHKMKAKVICGRNITVREKKARINCFDWNRGVIVSSRGRGNNLILGALQKIARKIRAKE